MPVLGKVVTSSTSSKPGLRRGRRALAVVVGAVLLAVAGCESTALSLTDPSSINVELIPQYMAGATETIDVELTFLGVEDPDDDTGEPQGRVVIDWDLGQGLELRSAEFQSNFRLTVTIVRYADAATGVRTVSLQIQNAYGTFVLNGEFYVL